MKGTLGRGDEGKSGWVEVGKGARGELEKKRGGVLLLMCFCRGMVDCRTLDVSSNWLMGAIPSSLCKLPSISYVFTVQRLFHGKLLSLLSPPPPRVCCYHL